MKEMYCPFEVLKIEKNISTDLIFDRFVQCLKNDSNKDLVQSAYKLLMNRLYRKIFRSQYTLESKWNAVRGFENGISVPAIILPTSQLTSPVQHISTHLPSSSLQASSDNNLKLVSVSKDTNLVENKMTQTDLNVLPVVDSHNSSLKTAKEYSKKDNGQQLLQNSKNSTSRPSGGKTEKPASVKSTHDSNRKRKSITDLQKEHGKDLNAAIFGDSGNKEEPSSFKKKKIPKKSTGKVENENAKSLANFDPYKMTLTEKQEADKKLVLYRATIRRLEEEKTNVIKVLNTEQATVLMKEKEIRKKTAEISELQHENNHFRHVLEKCGREINLVL